MPQFVPNQLNPGHDGGEKVAELRPLAQGQPDLNGVCGLSRPQSIVREHASNSIRWAPDERLNHLLEEACVRFATNDAVIGSGIVLSYRDFDRRANQLARHLLAHGIKSGDRVAMMFDRSPEAYVAMLAVMKVNAAYVPLDAAFPIERVRFILGDANVSAILSMSSFAVRLSGAQVNKIFLDSERQAIGAQAANSLTGVSPPTEPLSYIIYTSGTTGNPKGVCIGHASICNFVRVAAELYGYCARRSRLSGHVDSVRFLRRGDLGAADVRRDARAGPDWQDPDGRRARRLSAQTPCDRNGLCSDAALYYRAGRAGLADPVGRRRGLPAKSRGPMVSPRPPHSQHLRPHRGDRHSGNDRAAAGQAGHDRRTAPDLFDRHPRS